MARKPRAKAKAVEDSHPPLFNKADLDSLIEDANKAYSLSRDKSVNKVLERMRGKLNEIALAIPE